MKLLLDANISWRLISVLKLHFGECAHADNIAELDCPAKDIDIWQYAKDNEYLIVTRDNDFNDLISLKGFPPKIIWLKIGNCNNKTIADLLIRSKQTIQEFSISTEYGLLELYNH